MKPTHFTLQRQGFCPYYITEEEYHEFVKIITERKTGKLREILNTLCDTFGEDAMDEMVAEELEKLKIERGSHL